MEEHAAILQMLGNIMYENESTIDNDPIDWALAKLDKITATSP